MTRPHEPCSHVVPRFTAHPRHAQQGRTWPWALLALALLAAGGWWWKHRGGNAADGSAAAAHAPQSAASRGAAGGRAGPGGRFGAGVQPVSVAAVVQRDMPETVQAIGTLAAANTAVVRAQVDGKLLSVNFREGQPVKAGQVLAQIDPRAFQATLDQAQGTLARDTAQLKNAQVDLERYRGLLAQDSIAKQQVDSQEALVRQLQGTVQADAAQVENARLQLSYTRITAPISGRAGLRQVDMGNIIHASDTNGLVTITQTDPINVLFSVPEANAPVIRRALNAQRPLPVQAWDREMKTPLASGRVFATDNSIDTSTGTLKIKAQLGNPEGVLLPNQFVNVRLQTGTLPAALVVPGAAVQRGAQGSFVYVVKDDSTVTVREVKPGVSDGAATSVSGDLRPGERVVTDGADRLREGAKVEVIAPAAANAQPATSAAVDAASARAALLEKLTPEQRNTLKAMSADERRAFFAKLRMQQPASAPAGAR